VSGKRSRTGLAPWSRSGSREEASAYLRARLSLFTKLMFAAFGVLMFFVLGLYGVYPDLRPARATLLHRLAIAGLAAFVLLWYFALYRRKSSLVALYFVDFAYVIVIGAAFGMSAYLSADQTANVYSAFIWHTFAVFTRVVIVPSTGKRTLVVSSISYVPLVLASVILLGRDQWVSNFPPPAMLGGTFVFAVVSSVLAATGSRVIYGLRKQVSQAQQLGQYTLDEKIGAGGMGEVYRAHHAMLRRPTAIKLLALDKYGAENVERFEREVQHTSELTHPNTVAIYDYGRSPDGLFYYAMEYLDGIDLSTLVQRFGPQPPARVIHIMRQVCGALDEAHASGLIHRDIKPANIILCRRGRKPDVVKVVDFGLVKEFHRDDDASTPKVIAGTPAYLAPEAVNDPGHVGPRSDLYSLGAVGYYLLTGVPVFEGKNAVDLCVQHASKKPVPPSERSTAQVPPELESVILACLAKDPEDRPSSAQALRVELSGLSAYEAWDEVDAIAWWTRFESDEPAEVDVDVDADAAVPRTVTVDVLARTEADLGKKLVG
jgi:serine/threonine-protein kinase